MVNVQIMKDGDNFSEYLFRQFLLNGWILRNSERGENTSNNFFFFLHG